MVNKCSCRGCFTNFYGNDQLSLFKLPNDGEIRDQWIEFINRKEDISSMKYVFVCEKHFEEKYLNRNQKRTRLITSLKPVPTLLTDSQRNLPASVLPKITKQRKPPVQRNIIEDERKQFLDSDRIRNFSDINDTLLEVLEDDFLLKRYEDRAVFYALETDEFSVPKITVCIRIDSELHVKLFYAGSPVPLPRWFCHGTHAKLTSKSMLENFPKYVRNENEKHGSILEELKHLKFTKSAPTYSANLIRYALMLRYSSLPAYKLLQNEFNLPSISFLRKLTSGNIDAMASANLLKSSGNISEDVILIFDEIYLQKCEEFNGGNVTGADDHGELYKGLMCFMIVGLKSNIPFVISSVPEKEISGEWLKDEILKCVTQLHDSGFNVRGIVCDDHSSNVSAYKKLLALFASSPNDLFITLNGKKIYLFFDTVHLIKNVRNNLINRIRFLFPEFSFNEFYDEVKMIAGEVSWHLLHQVYEKDLNLQAHLRSAPKLSASVLHPGNCKQSVPVALAIFDPTTIAAIRKYFPEREDAAGFLHLINVWWTISNSKSKVNTSYRLGNAAIFGDKKPQFLRALAEWIKKWDNAKIRNCERFTLSAQTSHALQRTLLCHASLIEDLLSDGFEFVLTARFQSDPLERRYGQYRQMSGGRFLVSMKDIITSEKILKIKSLVQEGFDIEDNLKVQRQYDLEIQNLLDEFEETVMNAGWSVKLDGDSKEVSDYVAGYIGLKMKKHCDDCCSDHLLSVNQSVNESTYVSLLSRGGLTNASNELNEYVAQSFANLDVSSKIIRKSTIPERKAGEEILKTLDRPQLFCDKHKIINSARLDRIITNIFFNNQRKRVTESVVKDRVASFKKIKRNK